MSKLQDKAYQLIKERIFNGTYEASSVLDDRVLSEEIGSSRTPVREALLLLANEGYVEILPKRAVVVKPFTVDNAMEIFEVRAFLEPWLIRTYGPTFTQEELQREIGLIKEENFELQKRNSTLPGIAMDHRPHMTLLAKCNNRYIFEMMKRVEQQSKRVPNVRAITKVPPDYTDEWREDLINEHVSIVKLIMEGKIEEAAEKSKWHVEQGRRNYMEFWFNQ